MQLEALEIPLKAIDSGFKAGLAAAAAGAAALVAGMGVAIKATFNWANEIDGLGDVMDGTNKQFAAMAFVARKSGVGVEALTKASVLLGKGLVTANGQLDATGKSLKTWGINVKDVSGNLKTQVELTDEIGKKYSTLSTAQERLNFLTEIYGKSGASMIDFFDTLAAEGGIDTVAAKVERLGLAIDPARYEQFNRNLEELKLVGLGLAVGFTEKVMPVIEKFLELISDPKGIDVSKILAWADNTVGSFIKGLGDSINNWVSGGGPEEFSENLISWIEGIGDSDSAKSKTQIAMEHLVKAMGEALSKIDWSGIWTAIDAKLDELDPIVTKAIDDAFISGDAALQRAFITMDESLNRAFITMDATLNESFIKMDTAFNNWVSNDVVNALNNFDTTATAKVKTAMSNMLASERTGLTNIDASFRTWASNAAAPLSTFEANVTTKMRTALTTLSNDIRQKLDAISQVFYSKSQSWINQAVQGLSASKQKILDAVTKIKTDINRILDQIKTSFTFSFNVPEGLEGLFGNLFGGGKKPPKQKDDIYIPKASGGPVFGGNPYLVGEMGPELFVPGGNGNIVPNNALGQSMTARLDDSQLRMLAVLIGESVIKGMNSA